MKFDSYSSRQRKMGDFLQRQMTKMSRRDELIAKAQEKRARKAAKRARDAQRSGLLGPPLESEVIWAPEDTTPEQAAQLLGVAP